MCCATLERYPSCLISWISYRRQRLAPAMDQGGTVTLEEYFEPRMLSPGTPAEVAGMQVDCRITTHMIPTIGLRLRHGAAAIGWSGRDACCLCQTAGCGRWRAAMPCARVRTAGPG